MPQTLCCAVIADASSLCTKFFSFFGLEYSMYSVCPKCASAFHATEHYEREKAHVVIVIVKRNPPSLNYSIPCADLNVRRYRITIEKRLVKINSSQLDYECSVFIGVPLTDEELKTDIRKGMKMIFHVQQHCFRLNDYYIIDYSNPFIVHNNDGLTWHLKVDMSIAKRIITFCIHKFDWVGSISSDF